MTEKKKRRGEYLRDFRKDENGRYVYTGRMYSYQGTDLKQRRLFLFVLSVCVFAAMIACGCIHVPGLSESFYVLPPYMVGLVSAGMSCAAAYHVWTGGDPMREYIYESGVLKLPGRSAFTAVCAAVALLGEVVYVILNGFEGKFTGFVIFLILEGASCAATCLIYRIIHKMKWS